MKRACLVFIFVACVPDPKDRIDAPIADATAAEDAAAILDAAAENPDAREEQADGGDAEVVLEPDATVAPEDASEPLPDATTPPPPNEPDVSQLGDTLYFSTGAELCDYVNQSRRDSMGHERYRGGANAGYHTDRTWPLTFTVDAQLMTDARAEALRIAAAGSAPGSAHGDGFRYRRVYADGVNTSSYQVSAKDEPGDWNVAYFKSGLINSAAAARQYLYYHDPGGEGPVLRSIGCGGADDGAGSVWWVVLLRP